LSLIQKINTILLGVGQWTYNCTDIFLIIIVTAESVVVVIIFTIADYHKHYQNTTNTIETVSVDLKPVSSKSAKGAISW